MQNSIHEYIPYIFIFIGSLNIVIILYFRYFLNKAVKNISQVINLNQDVNYDIEKFLQNLSTILREIGIKDYEYKLYFQNQLIDSKTSKNSGKSIEDNIVSNDYKVTIKLFPKRYMGENQDNYLILLKILKLIIQEDILIKNQSIDKSFSNITKFHTFILHDTKNISQFFQTLNYNIKQCKTQEDKDRLFEYLKKSTVTLNDKSSKILKLLEVNNNEESYDNKIDINLKEFIKDILHIQNLQAIVTGDAILRQNETAMYMIIENIVKNISDKKKHEPNIKTYIAIEKKDQHTHITFTDTGSDIKNIARVFEPFFTTKQSGLGIGLYKVKTIIDQIGGKINVANTTQGVEFKLIL
ncbi:MAG: HAMP domain-containing sensor histidine kinase [Campylobacterota bacterium]|nr:HAMP domain-containing sensor histidine kinase [Campylobacterota bacterium]